MVLVLAKCGKISNVQVARSAVTVVLKKDILAVRKSYLLWAVGAFKLLGRSF